jgi:hypothetical protein
MKGLFFSKIFYCGEITMKTKLLAAAVMAAGVNTAMALPPGTTPDLELFIGGASAQDKTLVEVITSLCDDTPDIMSDSASFPGSNHTAFFCTMSSAKVPGFPATGLKTLVYKRSKGGSAFGAAPVEAHDQVARMLVDNTCTPAGTNRYTCTGTVNATVDAGITDIEPDAFRGPNLLLAGIGGVVAGDPGTAPMSAAQLSRLDKAPTAALTFGVVVTTNLRNALQTAQGLSSGSDEESQMPSLTKAQVASLFTGATSDWSEFKAMNAGTAFPLNSYPGVTAPTTTSRVFVCRRTQGSGTQAVFNQYFLNQPCDSTSVVAKADNTPASATNGTGNYTSLIGVSGTAVHWNESSGNVDACLNSLNTNGRWAVGIQSLEKTQTYYRFVKINGVSPLLENVASGKYDELGITSFQWVKETEADGLAGNKLTLAKKLRADLSRDTELATANLGFGGAGITIGGSSAVGKVGFAALASNGFTLNIPFDTTKPVIPFSNRDVSGTADANSCRAKVILGGSSQM